MPTETQQAVFETKAQRACMASLVGVLVVTREAGVSELEWGQESHLRDLRASGQGFPRRDRGRARLGSALA